MPAQTEYRGRFAPSPSGVLHFGSIVAAVASYAQARRAGGVWLVRMEDLDPPREVAGAADRILRDLEAFGMVSDEPVLYQSQRSSAYREALEQLSRTDLAYPCGCTRRELPADGIYPGTCAAGLPAGKRERAIRVRVGTSRVRFRDAIMGPVEQHMERDVGDFVIRRADGLFAYQLAVVVDDAAQRISEIVRGCDLLDSTPRQVFLQQTLKLPTPAYAHVPLAIDGSGRKLSKQSRAQPVDADDPLPALLAAWAFLGQKPPPASARRRVVDFWTWAAAAWRIGAVPATRQIPISKR